MNNREILQKELDEKKWYLSEEAQRDMCGTYEFCAFCDKSMEYPCATAFEKFEASVAVAAEEQSATANDEYDVDDEEGKGREPLIPFAIKLENASPIIKERYQIIRAELLSYYRVKSFISKSGDSYRAGRGNLLAKISISGRSLRVAFPLDPKAPKYNDGTWPHLDVSAKTLYKRIPFFFRVTSKLAVKRCKALIADVMENDGIEKK